MTGYTVGSASGRFQLGIIEGVSWKPAVRCVVAIAERLAARSSYP
jgi:hypothetical protein